MNIKSVAITILSLSVLLGMHPTEAKDLITNTKIFQHNQKSGGSGVDSIRLKAPKTPRNYCSEFVNAQIQYTKRHYGEVKIIKHPKAQCNPKKEQCKLSVSWKHSPAGQLDYKVNITWTANPCK